MIEARKAARGPASDPFGRFKAECQHLRGEPYSNLQKSDKKRFPELDLAPTLEDPPNPDFGHLASSLSFELARVQKTKPMAIAREIVDELNKTKTRHLVESIQAAEPGYVNFIANIGTLAQLTLDAILQEGSTYGLSKTDQPHRVIVEHTSANPARPIHIGTAKNSIFGDTLARILDARGHTVKTHFYIDDTGRQVAQMAYGYKLLGEPRPDGKPDEFFGKKYSITSTLVELDDNKKRRALLKNTDAPDMAILAVTTELHEWAGVAAEIHRKYRVQFSLVTPQVSE